MRWRLWLILILQAVLVLLLAIAVETGVMPLGVRGEWQWMRLGRRVSIPWDWLALAGLGVAASAGFVGVGLRALTASRSRWSEASWLAALLAAAIAAQVIIPLGAADEYDLTKWAYVNYFPGSAGYFKIARDQAAEDPWGFL